MSVFGPYETETAADAEEMPRAVRHLPHDTHTPGRASRDLQLSFLREACTDAGVKLGKFDDRTLTWLCTYEPASVQVLIGLISRSHAAGVEQGRTNRTPAASRLERVLTDDGCYRVLGPGVGAGSVTFDPFADNLDVSWLPVNHPAVSRSAAQIAAGTLGQYGEDALWEHLETLFHQLSDQDGRPSRG